MRGLVQGVQPLPIGRRIAAVHRGGEVEAVVAPGDELRVEVGDDAVRVGVDGVVG